MRSITSVSANTSRYPVKAAVVATLMSLSLATPAQAILSGSCPAGIGPTGPLSQAFEIFNPASSLYDAAIGASQSNVEIARSASEAAYAALRATGSNANNAATQAAYAAWQAALISEASVLATECSIMIALITAVDAETGGTCLVKFEHQAFRSAEVLPVANVSLLNAIFQLLAHSQTCITFGQAFPQLLTGITGGTVRDAAIRAAILAIQTDEAALLAAITSSMKS